MPDLQLECSSSHFIKTTHFLCLLLDTSLNISTSHSISTPSAFEIILQLMFYAT